jgi:enoyl-CoA hydratase/carnithine racemase
VDLKVIRYELDGPVAICTLNRPERLNAWTNRMASEYRWVLEAADADPAVRVVVVTGAGRGFCAGADMAALGDMAEGTPYQRIPDADGRAVRADFDQPLTVPLGLSKPVIAAVNGPAAGVGFVLMSFCDLRFAAAGVKLTTSFARLGLPAEHGISWLLPRLLGPARAADLLLSGRVVGAEEALELGLLNRVVAADELLPVTIEYARTMAEQCAPSSLATIKAQLYGDLLSHDLASSARRSVELAEQMVQSADFAEGVAALREKRPPRFTDR